MKLNLPCCAIAIFFFAGAAIANNNFFMPGDAFFPTSCTQRQLDNLTKNPLEEHSFQYDSYGSWEGAFCGNAGFTSAHFAEFDEAFLENLRDAYKKIREEYPKELVEYSNGAKTELRETNPIQILFYREDFPYQRKKAADSPTVYLGLRYNENWIAETVKFGHSKHRIRMCQMVSDPSAIIACWRDSAAVPALGVEIPDGFDYRAALLSEAPTPIRITGKIRAIVLPPVSLDQYYKMNTDFYSASNDQKSLLAFFVSSSGVEKKEFIHDPWAGDDQ